MQEGEKSSFVLYAEYFKHIKKLSMQQRGELLTAILSYASGEEQPELDAVTDMIFGIIKERMDRDFAAYMDKVEKRRNAGTLGGRPKKANGFSEKQEKACDFSRKQEKAKEPNGFPEKQEKAKKANGFSEKQKNPDTDNVPVLVLVNNKNTLADAKATFERLWKLYPNKKGKGKVSDTQKKRLLAIGESTLVKAIERYSLELQKDADWRKAQYGSTFFNGGYIDYLDDNYVPGEQPAEAKKNAFNNFSQREYDYGALETMLLQADAGG